MYVKKQGSENPDIILQAYEYANLSLEIAREALEKTANSERAALEAEKSAKSAQLSSESAKISADEAKTSANYANISAENSEASAKAAQTSATNAETSATNAEESALIAVDVSNTANENSENALKTSNDANEKSTIALDIVENLTVSSKELDCTEHPSVEMQTNASTKRKNINFNIPAPKQGKSYRNRGPWDSSIEYINDEYYIDTVSIHGCTYLCKQTNINKQPLASEENEFWGLIALKGSDAGVTVVDNLDSENADYVLSAKQGKILKELIESSILIALEQVISNAPENLNTLYKLANAINNDENFSKTISEIIENSVNTLTNSISSSNNKINDLQNQINNMLNGTTKFTLVSASKINLD